MWNVLPVYDITILNLLERVVPNQKPLFLHSTYFLESYILYIGIIPVYIIRPGTPYTSILLSLPLEGLEPTSGCVQKNRGWRKRKKGAKKAAGEEETPGWINGRNIKRRGEGGEENRKKRSITRKAAVAARYRSLAPFASHLTLRIRDMMLEY